MSEKVYVINGNNTYHYSKNCCNGTVKSNRRWAEWKRDMAESWGKSECEYCAGNIEWYNKLHE